MDSPNTFLRSKNGSVNPHNSRPRRSLSAAEMFARRRDVPLYNTGDEGMQAKFTKGDSQQVLILELLPDLSDHDSPNCFCPGKSEES